MHAGSSSSTAGLSGEPPARQLGGSRYFQEGPIKRGVADPEAGLGARIQVVASGGEAGPWLERSYQAYGHLSRPLLLPQFGCQRRSTLVCAYLARVPRVTVVMQPVTVIVTELLGWRYRLGQLDFYRV